MCSFRCIEHCWELKSSYRSSAARRRGPMTTRQRRGGEIEEGASPEWSEVRHRHQSGAGEATPAGRRPTTGSMYGAETGGADVSSDRRGLLRLRLPRQEPSGRRNPTTTHFCHNTVGLRRQWAGGRIIQLTKCSMMVVSEQLQGGGQQISSS